MISPIPKRLAVSRSLLELLKQGILRLQIRGIDKLSAAELERELAAGGRFVFYEYCISILIVTFRRPSAIYFLKSGEQGILRGLPYSLISLILGWWGLPWGFIYTPLTLVTNFTGGCNVTATMRPYFEPSQITASGLESE